MTVIVFLFQESSSNTTVSMENSSTKLAETPEKDVTELSVTEKESTTSIDKEKCVVIPKDGAVADIGSDEKISDSSVEEDSKAKEETHSDPETGEFEESLLLSAKEPSGDVTDNRIVSPVENIADADTIIIEVRVQKKGVAFAVALLLAW